MSDSSASNTLNWSDPDYKPVFTDRLNALQRIRAAPELLGPLKIHYSTHPAAWISDWGMTFDPRLAEIGKATTIPFYLFPRQVEFTDGQVFNGLPPL